MGFRLPSFNLTCRIWSRTAVPAGPVITANLGPHRIQDVPCQLKQPNRSFGGEDALTFWVAVPEIVFPPLTDVRDNFSWDGVAINRPDLIECPQDSEVYYTAVAVYDVAKGFANEYRLVIAYKNARTPIPMP